MSSTLKVNTIEPASGSTVTITGLSIGAGASLTSPTITGGTITGITDLAVADGGTGASTAAGARTNLSVPSTSETILQTLADAKGDLIAASGADTWAKQSAGADNTLLGYDSSQTNGVRAFSAVAPISVTGGTITTSMATSRLIGRTTAATGVMEEITVGSGLTLSAGSLSASGTGITLGTEQATTSGTSIDFTGIPSTTKRIVLMLVGVSTNGTSNLMVQLGDSGGIETSGYDGAAQVTATVAANGSGFLITAGIGAATDTQHGIVVLTLEKASSNTWCQSGNIASTANTRCNISGGSKSTSATLDRIRLTTAGGADTFDAGAVNITYE